METTSTLERVRTADTRGGNTRYVIRDADGKEYTTFREHIGERAKQLEGRRVQPFEERVAQDLEQGREHD